MRPGSPLWAPPAAVKEVVLSDVKEKQEGMGLGLVLAHARTKNIDRPTRQMDSSLHILQTPETFSLELPQP